MQNTTTAPDLAQLLGFQLMAAEKALTSLQAKFADAVTQNASYALASMGEKLVTQEAVTTALRNLADTPQEQLTERLTRTVAQLLRKRGTSTSALNNAVEDAGAAAGRELLATFRPHLDAAALLEDL